MLQEAEQPSLLFFDPDIGLAGNRVRKGGRRSARYLFYDELVEAIRCGHSLIVYQHFAREQRLSFLARKFRSIRAVCEPSAMFAIWSARVALIVIPQQDVAAALTNAAREFVSRWATMLTLTREGELVTSADKEWNDC